MNHDAAQLIEQALRLPEEERAEMAGRLLDSLDAATDTRDEAGWDAEILQRLEELDSGKVQPIPWSEVRRRIQDLSDDLTAS